MTNHLKTWLHCAKRLFLSPHRVCYYKALGKNYREYFCECSERYKEVIAEWEELYGEKPFVK